MNDFYIYNLRLISRVYYNESVIDFILNSVFKKSGEIDMSRLLKSRGYFMKCLGFVLLFGFISLGAIGGCSNNNGGGQNGTTTLTEHDFGANPGLIADPEKHLIVKFLEHPDSEGHENDTGEVGNDVFPLTYKRTLEHTYCWEDDEEGAGHFMELDDSEGNEILRIDVNGECVTEIIEAGDYVITIHHDRRIETTHSVFIIPMTENNQQSRETDGLINRFKVVIANILQDIQNAVSKDARAQSGSALDTLITTGKCRDCDLTGADLTGANLKGADLTGADLTGAIWINGDCACQEMSIGGCVGCQPLLIPRKILDLRPIRGMSYDPKPSDYCQINQPLKCDGDPATHLYFDTDFANDDFKGLWSSDNPGGTGSGRGDLEKMANDTNINFLHLYNWTAPTFRHHINFLNECSRLGIRVALPISNFTLQCIQGRQGCIDAIGGGDPVAFAKQNIKNILSEVITNGKPHEAIAMWLIGNEPDNPEPGAGYPNGLMPVVATAIQFLLEAEKELGVVADGNKLPISVPLTFGLYGAPPLEPGIVKTKELIDAINNNPMTAPVLATRFVVALNPFNKRDFMEPYLATTFPDNVPNVALWLGEYGFSSFDSGGETQQAQIVKAQLELCESLITNPTPTTNPDDYFLGCSYFEWLNEDWKGGAEATWGALKFDGTQEGTGRTVGVPTNGAADYPIDTLVEKPVYDSIKQVFMK
jgi:hypothetical protein